MATKKSKKPVPPKPVEDFNVVSHGTVWTFEPMNEGAKQFTAKRIQIESWQWQGSQFVVDHRMGHLLVEKLQEDGFIVAPFDTEVAQTG